MKVLADGSVEVTGLGTGEKGFHADLGEDEGVLDQLVVRSAIVKYG